MKYPSLRIEGPILSADIVEQIADGEYAGQEASAFGLDGRVRDEIARAWADARALWGVFSHQRERTTTDDRSGTSRTRSTWVVPLLALLGYQMEFVREAPEINGKKYPISHRAANRAGLPVHIVGFVESMDSREGRLMSAHSLTQEYLNLADQYLYAFVTNGLQLRLLRDASRLVRLSYVEFDLQRMMEEELYPDFALFFRLLHASRMPSEGEDAADCLLERYHQDAMENGERIRGGLSLAVERSLAVLAEGFLNAEENDALRQMVLQGDPSVEVYFHYLLVLVYRLLFLLVIEERDLVFPEGSNQRNRDIYYGFYSATRLRRLAEIARPEDGANTDLWKLLLQSFHMFEEESAGEQLGISALGGDLFGPESIGLLSSSTLTNKHLVECLQNLDRFEDAATHQTIKVNYGALNVEEFGSVYEGLLEKDPVIVQVNGAFRFSFKSGEGRSASGSHYTPEELTHPLIRHSLDHVIAARLASKGPDKEQALLSIRVCDPACGSGHILLNAARRIGLELARVRTNVDQPSPPDVRRAVRDAIRHCLYGVDKNPSAVELCKVALWLESHDPGEPLGFLDHHIKCGDSIVGIARREELLDGIPDHAFKRQSGDDGTASAYAKRNKKEREARQQYVLDLDEPTREELQELVSGLTTVDGMSEHSMEDIERKRVAYENLLSQVAWKKLRALADIVTAQYFLPKTEVSASVLTTDGDYLRYVAGGSSGLYESRMGAARAVAVERRFFHWFIEFPDVFELGGFDCILGNPPFLGGQKISGNYGKTYLHYLRSQYPPAGAMDLVGFFFRRNFNLLRDAAYFGLIATKTIAQGGTREGGLEPIAKQGGEIIFAIRSMKWPGLAAVTVSLVAVHKGKWKAAKFLDGKEVALITPYLDDSQSAGNPFRLKENAGKSFQGSIVLGLGFVLEPEEAQALIKKDPRNKDVLFPYLNGEDLNSRPDQSPSRWVINFFDWPEEKARKYPDCFRIVEEKVKPQRQNDNRKQYRDRWWTYAERRQALYRTIASLERVMVTSRVSKTAAMAFSTKPNIFSEAVVAFALSTYSDFCLMQSAFQYYWTCRNSSTLKGDLRYAPSDCFETFPFPRCLRGKAAADTTALETIGRQYYEHRQALMLDMQLGLTKTYNLFHDSEIVSGGSALSGLETQLQKAGARIGAEQAAAGIQTLRNLHVQMDLEVLAAYGWTDVPLNHDFHSVDFLPENARVRFTISPQARREVLKRLLELNHRYHAEEQSTATEASPKKAGRPPRGAHGPELGL